MQLFRRLDRDRSGEIGFSEFAAGLYTVNPITKKARGFDPSNMLTPEDAFDVCRSSGRVLGPLLLVR